MDAVFRVEVENETVVVKEPLLRKRRRDTAKITEGKWNVQNHFSPSLEPFCNLPAFQKPKEKLKKDTKLAVWEIVTKHADELWAKTPQTYSPLVIIDRAHEVPPLSAPYTYISQVRCGPTPHDPKWFPLKEEGGGNVWKHPTMTDEKGNKVGLRVNVMIQKPDERGEHFRGKAFRRIRFDPSEGIVYLDDFFLVHVVPLVHPPHEVEQEPVGGGSGSGGGNGEADAEAAGRAEEALIAQHRKEVKLLLLQEKAMLDKLNDANAAMSIDDYAGRLEEVHAAKLRIFAELQQGLVTLRS